MGYDLGLSFPLPRIDRGTIVKPRNCELMECLVHKADSRNVVRFENIFKDDRQDF